MTTVQLKALNHRQTEGIAVHFKPESLLQQAIKKISGIKWSNTHKCWWLPLSRANYKQIVLACNELAVIHDTDLKAYLLQKKQQPANMIIQGSSHGNIPKSEDAPKSQTISHKSQVHAINSSVPAKMKQQLVLKSYSPSTIKTYLNELNVFLCTIGLHSADEFTTQRLKDYLQYCAEKLKLSENTLHSRMNALKFYYEQVLGRENFFWEIPRPKKRQQLPKLLNEEEMQNYLMRLPIKSTKPFYLPHTVPV